MKNFGTIVAGIAGIAGLAGLSLGLWNGLGGTSVEQTAFITQQETTYHISPPIIGDSKGEFPPIIGDSKGEFPPIIGDSKGEFPPIIGYSKGGYIPSPENDNLIGGEVICGNGKIEGDEQCEDGQENKCKDQGSGANNDLVCNTYTCKCEQKPITGCYYGLAVAGGTITSHTPGDPKESRDGGVYTVKPGSYTIDCKFDTQHIFINGLSTNPQTYSLPVPSYPGNRYYLNCGSDTGAGCYYTIKVDTGTVYTGKSLCSNLGVKNSPNNIIFTPLSKLNDPAYGGIITIKKQGSYPIDCSKAKRDGYTPNKTKINTRTSLYPVPGLIPFFDDKKGNPSLNRLDCLTYGDDRGHPTCWYDVVVDKKKK